MKKRELFKDIQDPSERPNIGDVVERLSTLKPGECWETYFFGTRNPNDTRPIIEYVEMLRQAGLDIGKGDSQFGYRMPIPEKGATERYLQVFRRS